MIVRRYYHPDLFEGHEVFTDGPHQGQSLIYRGINPELIEEHHNLQVFISSLIPVILQTCYLVRDHGYIFELLQET
jgi:hypothetical protein